MYVSRMDTDRSAVAFNLLNVTPKLIEKYPALEVVIVGGGTFLTLYYTVLRKSPSKSYKYKFNTLGKR